MAAYAGSRSEKEDAAAIAVTKGETVKECDSSSLPPLSHELVFIQESFVSHAPELPVQHIVQDYSPIIKVPFPPNINAADLIRTDKNGQLLSRCTNKFLIYRNEYAKELRSHGYKLSMRKISSIAAACWKEEPEYVIRRYEEIAREVERIHMRLSMSGTPVVDEDIKKAAATSTTPTTTATTPATGMTRDKAAAVSRTSPYDIGASLRKSRNATVAVRASNNAIPSPSPSPPLASAMPRPNASSPVMLSCFARPAPQGVAVPTAAVVTAANVRPVPSSTAPSSMTTPAIATTTTAITASSERSQQASPQQQQQQQQQQQHASCANGVPLQDGGPPMAFGAYTSELLSDLCANIEAQQEVYNPLDAVYPSPGFTGDIIEQQQMSYEALLHSDVPSGWGWFVLDRRSH